MNESLKQRIQGDIADTMRARDKPRLAALRMVSAAIKQQEVDTRTTLDDTALLAVLERMIKQRRDSADQFRKGGRPELADGEEFEIGVIQAYMPTPLTAGEIATIIEAAITESGAVSPRDMGRVMALIGPRVRGRGDMGRISAQVKERLAGLR